MLQSINIFIANSQLSIIIYYTAKTGLLNFTQGSYKFYVGSPAGSHLSKLVATPGYTGESDPTRLLLSRAIILMLTMAFGHTYLRSDSLELAKRSDSCLISLCPKDTVVLYNNQPTCQSYQDCLSVSCLRWTLRGRP